MRRPGFPYHLELEISAVNVHRMKDVPVSTILQDVAIKCSNVAGGHAPEHALNLGPDTI